jgi:hypothetical protein
MVAESTVCRNRSGFTPGRPPIGPWADAATADAGVEVDIESNANLRPLFQKKAGARAESSSAPVPACGMPAASSAAQVLTRPPTL